MRHALCPSFVMLSTPLAILFAWGIPEAAYARALEQLNQVAQSITVRIEAERPGSGVIIQHQGESYTVLTAKHLVTVQDNYAVVTPDGQRYPVNAKSIEAIPDADLAIIKFHSHRTYAVAQLANYTPKANQYLFLSGFPDPSGDISEQIRLFMPGQVVPFEQAMVAAADPLSQGYRLFYNNIADPGMSGGAVIDTDGRLLGVHGRSDGEEIDDSETGQRRRLRLGISAGLPIRWLLQLRPDLQLATTNQPAQTLSAREINDFEQSIQALILTPSGEPNAVTWANYANLMYRTRRFPDALKAINKSLEIKFQFPQFWYAQGLILLEMRQYQDAINAFDRAIKLQPRFYRAWKSKAMTLVAMKRPQEAIAATDTALKLEEKSAVIWYLRGNIMSNQLQDFAGAVESFDRAIAVEPEFPAAWIERGRALAKLDRSAEALSSINQALRMDPSNQSAQELHQTLATQLQQP